MECTHCTYSVLFIRAHRMGYCVSGVYCDTAKHGDSAWVFCTLELQLESASFCGMVWQYDTVIFNVCMYVWEARC